MLCNNVTIAIDHQRRFIAQASWQILDVPKLPHSTWRENLLL